ncbi:hypothetical protein QR680_010107 [Steinernema hermaphroditum]|uniref:G protein-coupled receptor n=1 Tax=Steinernema hermaphroditum TaxID=289476 RepID=A0AA39IP48_9BILA|nr:hypothetical protein QR680_010107 [Steinernema hermaphroditum]
MSPHPVLLYANYGAQFVASFFTIYNNSTTLYIQIRAKKTNTELTMVLAHVFLHFLFAYPTFIHSCYQLFAIADPHRNHDIIFWTGVFAYSSVAATGLADMFLGIDRFAAITIPVAYKLKIKNKFAVFAIALCIAIVIVMAFVISLQKIEPNPDDIIFALHIDTFIVSIHVNFNNAFSATNVAITIIFMFKVKRFNENMRKTSVNTANNKSDLVKANIIVIYQMVLAVIFHITPTFISSLVYWTLGWAWGAGEYHHYTSDEIAKPSYIHKIIFGCVYFMLAGSFLPLYVFIVLVFSCNKNFRKHSCYWIMISIGICDCTMLACEMGMGIGVLMLASHEINLDEIHAKFMKAEIRNSLWMEKAFIGLLSASTVSATLMVPVLAFNRLFIITEIVKVPSFVYLMAILTSFVYIPFAVSMSVFEDCGLLFNEVVLAPSPFRSPLNYILFRQLEGVLSASSNAISLVVYLVIVAFLVSTRVRSSTVSHLRITNCELKLLFQCVTTFLFGGFLTVYNHYGSFGDRSYKYLAVHNVFTIFFYGGLRPVMHLMSNRQLREILLTTIFKRQNKTVVVKLSHTAVKQTQ